MFTKFRFLFMLVLTTAVVSRGTALAQPPKAIDFKLGDISLRLTNLEVVTGEPKPEGGLPDKTTPVAPDKLLPPDAGVWIKFDYETNFTKSDAPDGLAFLAVGIELSRMSPWGYQPCSITEKSGKGAVRIMPHPGGAKGRDINEAVKLIAFARTNKNEGKEAKSESSIPVKCRIDGVATLSTTQFAEIQAVIRKVAELEKKVQALEGKKAP